MPASQKLKTCAAWLAAIRAECGNALAIGVGARLVKPGPTAIAADDQLVRVLIESVLIWEAPTSRARAAMERLDTSGLVDANELRVCLLDEIVALMGRNYPRVQERAGIMKAALQGVYRKEHGVRLAHLIAKPPAQALAYFEAVEGVPAFVLHRAAALGAGAAVVPIDDHRLAGLIDEGVVEAGCTSGDAAAMLARASKDAAQTAVLLEAWAERLDTNDNADRPVHRDRGKRSMVRKTSAPPTAPPTAPTLPATSPRPTAAATATNLAPTAPSSRARGGKRVTVRQSVGVSASKARKAAARGDGRQRSAKASRG